MESRIKQLREKRGLIHEILAAELGITQQMLSKYERDITLIKVDILKKIAVYFNVTTDYSPYMGQYTVQGNGENNVKIGNYPIVNVYANVHIKHTRFFVMMSHINAGQGDKNYFFAPHYPMNERVFRIGVSWNFFN